jgi:uncharacterized repeat protein (TIGR04076 family)
MASSPNPTTTTPKKEKEIDDSFELYDLRVEVVCPKDARILCGAKEGDHFTLEGEMMYLPPGQGISIYSLCMFIYTFLLLPILTILNSISTPSSGSETAEDA